jgi:dTDP-4-dehydrorhamnose reductase
MGTCRHHAVDGLVAADLADEPALRALIHELEPAVIYLPAGLSDVDYCERNPEESYRTNVLGVRSVVAVAKTVGARLVYFSTDYIFDGRKGPYYEDEAAHPICEYGRHKAFAEHVVALHAPDSLILRTTVVFGWERQGKNFVQRLRSVVGSGQHLRVPVDQIGTPTYAADLARAAVELACRSERGVFHVAGAELASRFEFAKEAARVFGLDERLIEPVDTAALNQAARRPLNAGMRSSRLVGTISFRMCGYREGLRAMAYEQGK